MISKVFLDKHIQALFLRRLFGKEPLLKRNNASRGSFETIKIVFDENVFSFINFELIDHFFMDNKFILLGEKVFDCNGAKESNGHHGIDWQKDPMTSYRWKNEKLSQNEIFLKKDGLDIKYVWELGRMNYLPQIALAFYKTGDLKYLNKVFEIIEDFKNNNECGFGIQWVSPMDVSIRAINIIVSIWIVLSKNENCLDTKMKMLLTNMLNDHLFYIYGHLEINYRFFEIGNHYLADIVGILYASFFLKNSKLFAFAKKHLLLLSKEFFFEDGTYFEKSSNYHRLALELFFLGFSVLSQRCKITINNTFSSAVCFVKDLLVRGRHSIQIGDNDSGRIVKLFSNGTIKTTESKNDGQKIITFDEDVLDYNSIISSWNGLKRSGFLPSDVYYQFFVSLSKKENLVFKEKKKIKAHAKNVCLNRVNRMPFENHQHIDLSFVPDSINWHFYKDFGLLVCSTKSFFLSFKIKGRRVKNNGHIHNDLFSINLFDGERTIFVDPGSFCYNGNDMLRKQFKSATSHGLPKCCDAFFEYNGSFSMVDNVKNESFSFGDDFIKYCAVSRDGLVFFREVKINHDGIDILDKSNREMLYQKFPFFSKGYGYIEEVDLNAF